MFTKFAFSASCTILILMASVAFGQDKALITAIETSNVLKTRDALKKGADVNVKNKLGSPALILAAEHGNPEILLTLLAEGASLDAIDSQGKTALIAAVESGNADLAQVLLSAGASVNATDQSGMTALVSAKKAGSSDLEKLIRLYDGVGGRRERPCEYEKLGADDKQGEQERVIKVGVVRAKELLDDSMAAYGFMKKKDQGEEVVGVRLRTSHQFAVNRRTRGNFGGEKLTARLHSVEPQSTRIIAETWSPPRGRKNRQWTTAILSHVECLYGLLDAHQADRVSIESASKGSGEVSVPDGTPIRLRFRRHVFSETAKEGDAVEFQVADDVYVENVIVISKGTLATGRITEAQRGRGYNRRAALNFDVSSVKSVGGAGIALRSIRHAYRGGRATDGEMAANMIWSGVLGASMMKGEEFLLRSGTECSAFVDGDHVLLPR